MKMRIRTAILALLSAPIALAATGCSLTRNNLFANGTLSLERVHTEGITVIDAQAYSENDTLIVSGHVVRRDFRTPSRGHIDITVVSPDGKVLERTTARHPIVSKGRRRSAAFKARLDSVPPKGSIVRVVRRAGPHDAGKEG